MSERTAARFRATAGTLEEFGRTPQEALTALLHSLSADPAAPIVIWPYNQGDAFFTEAQQSRLQELKQRADNLTAEERQELQDLVAAAFDATVARTQSLPLVKT